MSRDGNLHGLACHMPWQPLQNHPLGHLGGWATPWSIEEMLDGHHRRVGIPAHARTAHNGLLHKSLEENPWSKRSRDWTEVHSLLLARLKMNSYSQTHREHRCCEWNCHCMKITTITTVTEETDIPCKYKTSQRWGTKAVRVIYWNHESIDSNNETRTQIQITFSFRRRCTEKTIHGVCTPSSVLQKGLNSGLGTSACRLLVNTWSRVIHISYFAIPL